MLEEANEYFSNRLWVEEWENANDTLKEKALNHAETQLNLLGVFSNLNLSEDKQNISIFEQALFLMELSEEDRERMRLQAENVESIDIQGGVREDYKLEEGSNIILAPMVRDLLKEAAAEADKKDYVIGDLI